MDDGREMLKMLDLGQVSFIALETRWRSHRLKRKRGQKSFSEEAVGRGRWARDAEDARSWPDLFHHSGNSMKISQIKA